MLLRQKVENSVLPTGITGRTSSADEWKTSTDGIGDDVRVFQLYFSVDYHYSSISGYPSASNWVTIRVPYQKSYRLARGRPSGRHIKIMCYSGRTCGRRTRGKLLQHRDITI